MTAHPHHHHAHDHAPPSDAGNCRRVLVAAVLTTGFMVAEAVGGLLTGSLALLADAGHMLSDSVALILAFVAFRLAERPGTRVMTYGFDRFQVLVAFGNGLAVFAIGAWIVAEAVARLLEPEPVLGLPMLGLAALGLLVNIAAFLVLSGGDRASLNMRGAMLHVASNSAAGSGSPSSRVRVVSR